MEVYFIRHKKTPQIIKALIDKGRIAIFFENQPWEQVQEFRESGDISTLPKNIECTPITKSEAQSYKTALSYFQDLSLHGGYLFAEYGDAEIDNGSKGCLFVEISKESKIEPLEVNTETIHVTLPYCRAEPIDYSKYPVLLAIRPPYSTICKPKRTFTEVAELLINKTLIEPSLNLFHPKMVEQLCVEYLIKNGLDASDENSKLDYCFLKPGKTLAFIDIAGRLKNGHQLYAQVKNSEISAHDENEFINFIKDKPEIQAVIFADFNKKSRTTYEKNNIHQININDVFNFFKTEHLMMEDMIGFKLKKED